jgi:phosphatidylserine decarboxylase
VNFESTLKEGVRVRKGDMLGHFLFGGSDFVMVFQAGYDFTLDSPRNDNQGYSHLLMGERLGRLQPLSGARH